MDMFGHDRPRPLMVREIVADPSSPFWYRLFPRSRVTEFQALGPDFALALAAHPACCRAARLTSKRGSIRRSADAQCSVSRYAIRSARSVSFFRRA
jgi:hypothetical protein